MASSSIAPYRDDEILVDRDGIPHYSGAMPSLMKEYRRRVIFAYSNLEGEGKDEAEETRDLERKKSRFAKKLLDALHGEAWKSCQDLMVDVAKLRQPDGYKHIFACLQSIEKVSIVKRTEAFDRFFDHCHRRRGQTVDSYIRQRKMDWSELQDIAEGAQMSDDLLAYFLLKNVGLSREDRRAVLLANQSTYSMEGIEKALRTSYFDLHEREARRDANGQNSKFAGKKGSQKGGRYYSNAVTEDTAFEASDQLEYDEISEDDEAFAVEEVAEYDQATEAADDDGFVSDVGASADDEVYEAYAAMDQQRRSYRDSRRKLKEIQKNRGFYKTDVKGDVNTDRHAARQQEKSRSRCGACGRIGHWAGDAECSRSQKHGPKKFHNKKGKSKGKGSAARAYLTGTAPMYFSLGEADEDEKAFCNMVQQDPEDEELKMEQDAGFTEGDLRRKVAKPEDWEVVQQKDQGYAKEAAAGVPWKPDCADEMPEVAVKVKNLRVHYVPSLEAERPVGLLDGSLSQRQLQNECEKWAIQVSGTKAVLESRLKLFFEGNAMQQKGCTMKFVQLKVGNPCVSAASSQAPIVPKRGPKAKSQALSASSEVPSSSSAKVKGKIVADQLLGNEDCRFFRPYSVPEGLQIGQVCPQVVCVDCQRHMVLLQNDVDFGLFFRCAGHPMCHSIKNFQDGLQEIRACRAEQQ